MKTRQILTLAAGALLLAGLASCSRGDSSRDQTIGVEESDPEMTAAIARARASLPEFWQILDHPHKGESGFGLKVGITDQHGTEHFWTSKIERQDGKVFGTIDNEPNVVRSVKLSERIQINEADISDWLYLRDGKMHGNYTLRALFKHMPANEVEQYRKLLANP